MRSARFTAVTAVLGASIPLAAVACGPKSSTEQASPSNSAHKVGLGRAAGDLPPDEETTFSTQEESTTSSEPPTTPPAAPVTTQPTITQAPVTQAPVTQPQAPITSTVTQQLPPQNVGPSESPPSLTASGSASGCGSATINWTGKNLTAVTITLNGTQVGSGGGSGSATVPYTCGATSRYNLSGSNSAGSASAYVDIYHS